jgi:hypothetical protein
MSTPFKMRGFSGFKSSPVQQAGRMHAGLGPGGRLTGKVGDFFETGIDVKEGDLTTETSFKPQFKVSDNLKIGAKFTGKSSKGPLSDPFSYEKSQTSLTGKLDLSSGRSNFRGSLSGEVGARDLWSGSSSENKGKGAGSVKLSLGGGSKKHNIGAFAEHSTSKHISGGGTKFGIEGKTGVFKGSVGYNIKSKKPEFKLGINI